MMLASRKQPEIEILFEELILEIAFFLPVTHGEAILNLALAYRKWRPLINSELYWERMLNQYFSAIDQKFGHREDMNGKTNKERFIAYSQNLDEPYITQPYFWPTDHNAGTIQLALKKLFVRARENDADQFLEIFKQELSLLQMRSPYRNINDDGNSSGHLFLTTTGEKLFAIMTEITDFTGLSMLEWAISLGHQSFLDRIYHYLSQENIFHELILAVMFHQIEAIKDILTKNPEKVNECTAQGLSPISVAARYGHIKIIECLLAHGANVNLVSTEPQSNGFRSDEEHPLCEAILFGHFSCVEFLLARGANINVVIRSQRAPFCESTPLSFAVLSRKKEMVELLLTHGVELNQPESTMSEMLQNLIINFETEFAIQMFDHFKPHISTKLDISNLMASDYWNFIRSLLLHDLMNQGILVDSNIHLRELLAEGANPATITEKLILPEEMHALFDVKTQFMQALNEITTKDMRDELEFCFVCDQELALLLIERVLSDKNTDDSHEDRIEHLIKQVLAVASTLDANLSKKLNGIIGQALFDRESKASMPDKMQNVLGYLIQADPNDKNIAMLKQRAYDLMMGGTGLPKTREAWLSEIDTNQFKTAVARVFQAKCHYITQCTLFSPTKPKEARDDSDIQLSFER